MMRSRDQVLDEWLIVSSQAGHADAMGELLRRWHTRLLDYARRLTRNDADAADAVQEGLLGIVRSNRRLDDPALFAPWAHRIVAHRCADLIRRRQRERRTDHAAVKDAADQRVAHEVHASETPEQIRLAIELLTLESRALIVMRYGRELSLEHIAATLGIPQGTVKSRLNHARSELKSILERNLS